MRTRILSSILVVLAAVGALYCAAPPEEAAAPAVDVAAEAAAIRAISAEWLTASQGRDSDTLDSLMSSSIVAIFDGEIREGIEAVRANREAEWAENPDSTVTWTTSSVEVAASGDLAYERGRWTSDADGPGAGAAEDGEYLTVYQKIDGEWKCVADAGTTLKADEEEM